jgi:hypothetical protein
VPNGCEWRELCSASPGAGVMGMFGASCSLCGPPVAGREQQRQKGYSGGLHRGQNSLNPASTHFGQGAVRDWSLQAAPTLGFARDGPGPSCPLTNLISFRVSMVDRPYRFSSKFSAIPRRNPSPVASENAACSPDHPTPTSQTSGLLQRFLP